MHQSRSIESIISEWDFNLFMKIFDVPNIFSQS